jgi:hypothetical protein
VAFGDVARDRHSGSLELAPEPVPLGVGQKSTELVGRAG